MKKKIWALVLLLAVLTASAASAELIGDIDGHFVSVEAPSGYTVQVTDVESGVCAALIPPAEGTRYVVSLAYSEEFVGYTLDYDALSDAEKANFGKILTDDMVAPSVIPMRTSAGASVVCVRETAPDDTVLDCACLVTIYNGFFAEVDVFPAEGDVTDAEIAEGLEILCSLNRQ